MAKKKFNNKSAYSQTKEIAKMCNKHGTINNKKLKGKEKKQVEAICTHHTVTKDGKVKQRVINNMDNTWTCAICHKRFSQVIPDKDDIKKAVAPVKDIIQGQKLMLQALGKNDQKSMDYLVSTYKVLQALPKVGGRIGKEMKKTKSGNRNRDRNRNRNGGRSQLGSWSS